MAFQCWQNRLQSKEDRQILFEKAEYILLFLQQRKEISTDMCVDHSMSVSVWVLQLIINGQAKILETKEQDMYKDLKDVLMISSCKPVTRHLVIYYFVSGFVFWWIQVHFFIFYFHAHFYKFIIISILKVKSLWEGDIIEGALWNNCVWILCPCFLCIQEFRERVIMHTCLLHITCCSLKLYIFMRDDQQILSTS